MVDERSYDRILEKRSKLDSIRPIDPGAMKRLRKALIVDMTFNSNSIEGNTLSLSETKLVLEEGITIGGKTLKEHIEATNHMYAMERVEELVGKKKSPGN
jgi:cell filamentation protein, protein adenylyltransferase